MHIQTVPLWYQKSKAFKNVVVVLAFLLAVSYKKYSSHFQRKYADKLKPSSTRHFFLCNLAIRRILLTYQVGMVTVWYYSIVFYCYFFSRIHCLRKSGLMRNITWTVSFLYCVFERGPFFKKIGNLEAVFNKTLFPVQFSNPKDITTVTFQVGMVKIWYTLLYLTVIFFLAFTALGNRV
jgi:hypothetical protein